ncbi:ATP-binding protein [Shewanella sp. GD04112]|uniref:AAA family ATPase n=1 Tax=Shewanella sp. GD04112 TaxID=2975434 RepID=UPI002446A786|nr:ATP-binding protein [Shewanella sp. GD04112]MDH0449850.1 ATP-binding protein [Shewanella sp. GD04112]
MSTSINVSVDISSGANSEISDKGTLVLLCGKMGAGKSTLARELAKGERCVLISEDEWLSTLYPNEIKDFDAYIHYAARLKPLLKRHIEALLLAGLTVVMDFPANTLNQRRWLLGLSLDTGAAHRLIYLKHSDELCLSRLALRRQAEPERAQFDTEAVYWHVSSFFQAPTEEEGLNIEILESSDC